jgi:hypothetical protein
MPTQSVFHWLDGRGWLVFSGGADDDIRAQALGRAAADGGVACLSLSGDPDVLLDDIADLGAPSGYIVDVYGEDDESLQDKLAQAGMIIITGGDDPSDVRGALHGAALDGIQLAYQHGAILLLEGASAMAFGAWIIGEEIENGLEWLIGGAVLTGVNNAAQYAIPIFEAQPSAIAVAIMEGSALVLGPDGEVESWGRREVTIALGPAYGT